MACPAAQRSGSDRHAKPPQPPGLELALEVKRKDAEREVKLKLRELLP